MSFQPGECPVGDYLSTHLGKGLKSFDFQLAHSLTEQHGWIGVVGRTWTLGEVWKRGLLLSPGSSAGKESTYNAGDPSSYSWVRKIPWRRDRLTLEGVGIPTQVFLGFPGGSAGKESSCSVGGLSLMPGFGRFPWRREWLLTPGFWPGKFHGLYSPWGHKESNTTAIFTFKPIVRSALQILCSSRDCCS